MATLSRCNHLETPETRCRALLVQKLAFSVKLARKLLKRHSVGVQQDYGATWYHRVGRCVVFLVVLCLVHCAMGAHSSEVLWGILESVRHCAGQKQLACVLERSVVWTQLEFLLWVTRQEQFFEFGSLWTNRRKHRIWIVLRVLGHLCTRRGVVLARVYECKQLLSKNLQFSVL